MVRGEITATEEPQVSIGYAKASMFLQEDANIVILTEGRNDVNVSLTCVKFLVEFQMVNY